MVDGEKRSRKRRRKGAGIKNRGEFGGGEEEEADQDASTKEATSPQ